jgi:hypothetical protein
MLKVEPLTGGTTDIDTLEAGWKCVDKGRPTTLGQPFQFAKRRKFQTVRTIAHLEFLGCSLQRVEPL